MDIKIILLQIPKHLVFSFPVLRCFILFSSLIALVVPPVLSVINPRGDSKWATKTEGTKSKCLYHKTESGVSRIVKIRN